MNRNQDVTPLTKPSKSGSKSKFSKSGGSPQLSTTIDSEAFEWASSRDEGMRRFLERIILEDKEKSQG